MHFRSPFNRPASQKQKQKSHYVFGEKLGDGASGQVRKAHWDTYDLDVAVKIVPKRAAGSRDKTGACHGSLKEVAPFLHHKNVVRFYEHFESSNKEYFVFELARHGELLDDLLQRGHYDERDAATIIRSVLDGVVYLHNNDIVHRDIKPENCLCRSPEIGDIVIADFDLAVRLCSPGEMLTTVCGTPGYCAPEVFEGTGYGKPADIFSIGIMTYVLLTGHTPYSSSDPVVMVQECQVSCPTFPDKLFGRISKDAKDFIAALTNRDHLARPTALEALDHPWFVEQGLTPVPSLASTALPTPAETPLDTPELSPVQTVIVNPASASSSAVVLVADSKVPCASSSCVAVATATVGKATVPSAAAALTTITTASHPPLPPPDAPAAPAAAFEPTSPTTPSEASTASTLDFADLIAHSGPYMHGDIHQSDDFDGGVTLTRVSRRATMVDPASAAAQQGGSGSGSALEMTRTKSGARTPLAIDPEALVAALEAGGVEPEKLLVPQHPTAPLESLKLILTRSRSRPH